MPRIRRSIRVLLVTVCCALPLSASGCGGGGSSPRPSPLPPPPPPSCGDWTGPLELAAGDAHSSILDVHATGSCRFVVAGYERSSHPGEPLGPARGFIREYGIDAQGRIAERWSYLLDSNGADAIHGLEVDDDAIRYWGSTTGAVEGAVNAGKKDVVLGSLSRAGVETRLSQFGNERPNVPLRLLTLAAGARLLVGNDEVYVPTNYVEAWEDPWLVQVTEYPHGYKPDRIDNRQTAASDFFTAGTGAGDSALLALRSEDPSERGISLRRQQPGGVELWHLPLSDSRHDNIAAVHLAAEEAIVFGTTYVQLGDGQFGAGDYFLAGVDTETGALNWIDQLGTRANEWARALIVHADGFTLIGEIQDADGNWSADVIELDAARRRLSGRALVIGQSLSVAAAAALADGLLIGGTVFRADGSSNGFVSRFASSRTAVPGS